ncbi:hypothetical protein NFI96_010196 [Prochilodus magdalenae]|nr:hypothetical protein NFI96_010196 [Prochilodus magdalenae]
MFRPDDHFKTHTPGNALPEIRSRTERIHYRHWLPHIPPLTARYRHGNPLTNRTGRSGAAGHDPKGVNQSFTAAGPQTLELQLHSSGPSDPGAPASQQRALRPWSSSFTAAGPQTLELQLHSSGLFLLHFQNRFQFPNPKLLQNRLINIYTPNIYIQPHRSYRTNMVDHVENSSVPGWEGDGIPTVSAPSAGQNEDSDTGLPRDSPPCLSSQLKTGTPKRRTDHQRQGQTTKGRDRPPKRRTDHQRQAQTTKDRDRPPKTGRDHQRQGQTTKETHRPPKTSTDHQRQGQTTKGRDRPPKTGTDHQRQAQTTKDRDRPPKTSTDHQRQGQTTKDRDRPPKTSTDHQRQGQTTKDRERPPKTGTDHQRQGETTKDRDRPPKRRTDHQRQGQTTKDRDRPPKTGTDHQRQGQTTKDRDRPPKTGTDHQRQGQTTRVNKS